MFDSAAVPTPLAHRASAAGGATALFVALLIGLRAATPAGPPPEPAPPPLIEHIEAVPVAVAVVGPSGGGGGGTPPKAAPTRPAPPVPPRVPDPEPGAVAPDAPPPDAPPVEGASSDDSLPQDADSHAIPGGGGEGEREGEGPPGPGAGPGAGGGGGGGSVDRLPEARREVLPRYPQAAHALGLGSESCAVRIFIDDRGRPTDAQVMGCPTVFHPSARAAAMQWRFRPARSGGVRVESTYVFRVRFEPR